MIDYKITPTQDGQQSVTIIGKNGEPLNMAETLPTVPIALKNVKAVIRGHNPKPNSLFRVYLIGSREVLFLNVTEQGDIVKLNKAAMNKRHLKRFGLWIFEAKKKKP